MSERQHKRVRGFARAMITPSDFPLPLSEKDATKAAANARALFIPAAIRALASVSHRVRGRRSGAILRVVAVEIKTRALIGSES